MYRDDFMVGFTLPDSPEFDGWQFFQGEEYREELSTALGRLIEAYSTQRDYEPALPFARRRLSLDPLHEAAHRDLMRLYALTGQRAAALRQYQVCVQTLEEELGTAPTAETANLYEQIRTADFGDQRSGESVEVDSVRFATIPKDPVELHNIPVPINAICRPN